MKLRMMFSLLVAISMTGNAAAFNKVIYGDDDRLDIHEVGDSLHLELARSTAAMISHSMLDNEGELTKVNGRTLESRGICSTAKFAKQITSANCSGFLVGKNLLVTAGHCIRSQSDCERSAWVFDFAVSAPDKTEFSVPTSSVYSCKSIVSRSLNRSNSDDFALLELDREVTDRAPLTVRTSGKVAKGTNLVVIGHPTGLPTKVAAGAIVRSNSNPIFFESNLDTFGGNSGSAVFDSRTGVVEGILVRGETDYVYNRAQGCRVPKVCTNTGCRGEDVTRITNIKVLMDILAQQN